MTRIWKGKRILSLALALILLMTSVNLPAPIFAANEEQTASDTTEQTNPMVGCKVKLAEASGLVYAYPDPSNASQYILTGSYAFPKVMVIKSVYESGSKTYYQIFAAEGYSWPENSNVTEGYYLESTKVTILEHCDKCGKIECGSSHENWCEICKVDNCTNDHIYATITDSQGKAQTITVAGDLPDDAKLSVTVPTINGEALPNVYDIKVYDKDGNEWQPIDEGKTVTLSLPVPGAPDDAQAIVTHFIDYAKDINGDEEFVSVDGLEGSALTLLQPAIAACTKQGCVAVETTKGIVTDGVVTIETDSFSVYTPDYDKLTDNFTVSFTSGDQGDPASGKTYYVTVNQEIKFDFMYDAGSFLYDKDQWGQFSLTYLADGSKVDLDTESKKTSTGSGLNKDYWITESANVVFSNEALRNNGLNINLQPGDIFQIDWKKTNPFQSKNPRWTRVMIVGEYTPSFQANGGKWSNGAETLTQMIVSYQPVNVVEVPTRDGYIFTGWNTAKDGSGITYLTTENFPATIADGTIFYAQWKPTQYKVTYVLPDGVGNKDKFVTQIKDHDVDLPLYTFVPDDIDAKDTVFKGWDYTGDGIVDIKKQEWLAGYIYRVNEDLTLVGIWDASVFVVMYDANGGVNPPATQYLNTAVDESEKVKLSAAIPQYPGRKFLGWKCDIAGCSVCGQEGIYHEAGKEMTVTSNVVLYAQWKQIQYTIEFDGNGSTGGSMDSMTGLLYDRGGDDLYANLTANAFSKTGYNFQGWALTPNANMVLYTNGQNVKMSNLVAAAELKDEAEEDAYTIKLYAVWAQNTYTITYNANGGSVSNVTQKVIVNGDVGKKVSPVIDNPCSKSGYTFAGWSLSENGEVVCANGQTLEISGNVTLYAVWEFNVVGYIATMTDTGAVPKGTVEMENVGTAEGRITYSVKTSVVCPTMIFRPAPGYKITRVIDSTGEKTDIILNADGSYTYAGGGTLTGPFYVAVITEPINYTITFDTAGGNAVTSKDFTVEDVILLPEINRAGYTFAGWRVVTASGNWTLGTIYGVAELELVAGMYGNVTLKAQWNQATTTLTIDVKYPDGADYSIDGDQAFLFDISDSEGVLLMVAVLQNGQVMIDGLTIGKTYTVTLKNSWSWRYDVAANGIVCENVEETEVKTSSVQLVMGTDGKVTFTMKRTNDQWLDGNAYSKN